MTMKPIRSGPEMMIRHLIGPETFDEMKRIAESGVMTKFISFIEGLDEMNKTLKHRLDRIESTLTQQTMELENVRRTLLEQRTGQHDIEPGSNPGDAIERYAGYPANGVEQSVGTRHNGAVSRAFVSPCRDVNDVG